MARLFRRHCHCCVMFTWLKDTSFAFAYVSACASLIHILPWKLPPFHVMAQSAGSMPVFPAMTRFDLLPPRLTRPSQE